VLVAQSIAAIAVGLLGLAGVAKVLSPDPTVGALRAVGLPAGRGLVRGLGAAEVVVAVAAVLWPPAVAAAGLAYLGFVGFTAVAARLDTPLRSCGCFGRDETPSSPLHVVFNVVAAGALLVLAVSGMPLLPALAWLELVGFLAFAAVGVYVAYLLLAVLPETLAVARS
jgi:hypothetical protein